MHKLTRSNDCYSLNYQRKFVQWFPKFKSETIKTVFEFAYAMSFDKQGAHRDHRSGGTHHRKNGEIFINAFQGKLSELAVYNYFFQFNRALYPQLSDPDFSVNGLSEWDNCDLQLKGECFSIKSTKYYGNLLLLEQYDWNQLGQYKPNINSLKTTLFDYFILVRIKPDGEGLLKSKKYLYLDCIDKETLFQLIYKEAWYFDIPGYINHNDLIEIIKQQQLLPQDALLNETEMDADNYYVQSGDLRSLENLISEMKNEL